MWDTFGGRRAFGFGVNKKPQGLTNGIQTGGYLGKIRTGTPLPVLLDLRARTNMAEFTLGGGRNVKPGA